MLSAPLLLGAAGPALVPDVSDRRIDIVTSFTGADLLLFGAILYPRGRTPAAPPDVAVVVRGPAERLLVREKARVAGIWINRESRRFVAVPSFYAVATSRPIDRMVSARTAARFGLGVSNLSLRADTGGDPRGMDRFRRGVIAMKQRDGLFAEHVGSVTIRDGVLYRAIVPIPARVSTGTYTAETFLIADGRVTAAARRTIRIDKAGVERLVFRAATERPLLYGLAAVALSLLLGWIAALLFRRR
jgi:uncharacterized protein (TIGR02186 family)